MQGKRIINRNERLKDKTRLNGVHWPQLLGHVFPGVAALNFSTSRLNFPLGLCIFLPIYDLQFPPKAFLLVDGIDGIGSWTADGPLGDVGEGVVFSILFGVCFRAEIDFPHASRCLTSLTDTKTCLKQTLLLPLGTLPSMWL